MCHANAEHVSLFQEIDVFLLLIYVVHGVVIGCFEMYVDKAQNSSSILICRLTVLNEVLKGLSITKVITITMRTEKLYL